MLKLNFYDEEPATIKLPSDFNKLKEIVSNIYGFSKQDANEFIYSFLKTGFRIYINSNIDYIDFFKFISNHYEKEKKIYELYIEINKESNLYQQSESKEKEKVDNIAQNENFEKSFNKNHNIFQIKEEKSKSLILGNESNIVNYFKLKANNESFDIDYSGIFENKLIAESIIIDDNKIQNESITNF